MSYVAIVAVILFVVGFATGPGSIPWFFVTELFAQSGRPTATSIAVSVNWSANFLVGLGFEPIQVMSYYSTTRLTEITLIRCCVAPTCSWSSWSSRSSSSSTCLLLFLRLRTGLLMRLLHSSGNSERNILDIREEHNITF